MGNLNKFFGVCCGLLLALGLSACSNNGGGSASSPISPPLTAQSCAAGSLHSTQYGCLPQAGCPVNYGMYNNQCVPANSTAIGGGAGSCQGTCPAGSTQTQYGCLPQGVCMPCYGLSNGWCYPASSASTYGNTYMY